MSQPQAVIFDIGNVLTRWQPEAFYDRVIGEDRRRALFAEVDLHRMNDIVDEGIDARGHAPRLRPVLAAAVPGAGELPEHTAEDEARTLLIEANTRLQAASLRAKRSPRSP